MRLFTKSKRCQRIVSGIISFIVATTSFLGIGSQTVNAAISPLITSYKPQVVNADANVSYTDSNGNTVSATIHHPGIVMSMADLDNMRDHVRAGDEPWNTAFNAFASDSRSSTSPRIYYESGNDIFVNILGPWATTVNGVYYSNPSDYVGTRANTDSETAFMQAIMWYITGNETYRFNAMTIIRDYSAIQSCVTHTSFRFATMTYLLGAAAEILRYSDTPTSSLDWTTTDTTNLTNAMNIVSVTYNAHTFFMNQHQFTVGGTMARAIFTNDLQLYAEAVEAATVNSAGDQGGRNGSIKYEMRMMTQNEETGALLDPSDYHVQEIEMGRDVGHSYADVGGLSTLAQMLYAQGTKVDPVNGTMSTASNAVNAFNFLDDRLLAGVTYLLKYHLGYDELWTPAWANQASNIQYYDSINADGRGRIDPYLNVLYNYYKYIEQRDMTQEKYKYLAYAYETRMPEVAGKDYPLATLLSTPDAAKTVGLSNQITLGAISGLSATAAGSAAINLSWTAVSKALGYNIYRSTDPNGTFTKLNSAPITAASYSDTGLTPNTIYYYQVGVAGGSTSSAVSATTGGTGVPALDASSYTLMVNDTHKTVLSVMYSDRSTQDLTSQASYASSNTAVATVDSAGVVTGVSVGTATITATYNGQSYTATVQVVLDTNLKTWYKFDEASGTTAADSSGYGNNGIVNGGTNATWTTGKSGNAVNFGGANTDATYVALPGNLVDNMSTMTFAAWVNSSNTSDYTSLFTAGPAAASSPTEYMMFQPKASRFMMTTSGSSGEQSMSTGSNLAANTWKHIAITLNGSTGTLYIDGAQVAQKTGMTLKPSDLAPTTSGNFIGKSEWTGDKYVKGQVDDFRLYNRALSASEITSVMNGQTVTTVPTAPTGVAATAADYSSINLSWSAVTGATGYNVYVATSSAVNAIYTKVNTDAITGTTFTSNGLKANTIYYYKVTAVNAVGESGVSGIALTATPNSMPDASLIAWYKFDETSGTTAADSSGYGNNGTVSGGSNVTWTTGKYDNAINFGGANTDATYVSLPSNLVDNLTTMTVSAWVNSSNTSDAISLFTAGPAAASTPTKYMMLLLNGSRFTITANGNSAEQNISQGSNLTANTWKHVAVTLSGSTGILYIDGVQVATNTGMTWKPSDLAPTTSGNFIGKSEWTGDKYLKGQVDDFRIYNRALSASEVTSAMNGQTLTVPAVPTGVSAKALSGSQISLGWTAASNATSYNIKRATVSGGPYTAIATGVLGTSYTDTGLTAGTAYYYVVSAVNPGHESANSTEASATLPIAQLKFNETSGTTAADATGSGWNGTLVNGPLWAAGKSGNAVDLDGTNDYVSLPAGVVSSASTATISAWVNLDAVSTWMRIFDFGSGTSTYMFLTPKNGSNKIRFAIRNNGSSEQIIDGTSALATGGWHHVAVTLNGATGTLYVDGAQVGQNTAMTLKPSDMGSTTQNWIGRSQFSTDPYLNGRVDDFRIYSKALSASEVATLASMFAGPQSLTASANLSQVALSWSSVANATSYNVKRATVSGGPYTTIATGVAGTGFTDTGVTGGTTYYYVVSAVTSDFESDNSAEASSAVLAAPQNLSASANLTQVALYWSAVANAASYNIKRAAASGGGPYTTIASGITGTSFTDTGLTPGTTYYYVVSAVNSANESVNSAEASAAVLAAPQNLTATANLTQAALSWTYVANAASYNVKRATASGGPYTTIAAGVTGTSYTDTGLTGGATYYYVVSAVNSANESVNSTEASATILAAPQNLTATDSLLTMSLSWSSVTNATSYNVKRADVSGGPYTTIATGVTGTTYTDTGLTAGATYYYVVSAVNSANESVNSAEVSAIVNLLAAYLKFDETSGTTAADTTGNGWNGTLVNGPVWVAGKSGNAVKLDGTNDYVALPAGVVASSSTSTVTAWVYLDAVSNWTRIFDFGSGTSTYMFLTPKNGSNGKIRFAIKVNNSSEQIIDGNSALATGGWHHVAVALNGATGTLYVDGAQVGSNTAMTLKPSDMGSTTQNWIGRSQFSTDPYLNGRVDDFRIYTRALTASEIAALAQ